MVPGDTFGSMQSSSLEGEGTYLNLIRDAPRVKASEPSPPGNLLKACTLCRLFLVLVCDWPALLDTQKPL